jgi:hypothetical protein
MFKGTAMPSKKRQYKLSIHITDYQLSTKPAQSRHKDTNQNQAVLILLLKFDVTFVMTLSTYDKYLSFTVSCRHRPISLHVQNEVIQIQPVRTTYFLLKTFHLYC